MALIFVCGMWLLLMAVQIIGMLVNGAGFQSNLLFFLLLVLSCGFLSSSILLPVIFKFGTEKGRLAFMVVICLICGGSAAAVSVDPDLHMPISADMLSLLILVGCIVLFLLSWQASIKIYEKREL